MNDFRLFPVQASTLAPQVDYLFFFLVALTVFFTVAIAATIVAFMIRFKRRSHDERPHGIHGSNLLEFAWSIIPFIISIGIFGWGAVLYANIRRPPDDALYVNVVGKQWMWKVQHMEGRREINELHIPVGKPVQVTLASEDVIHSFYVPAFRTKMDAVPGRYTLTWFEATQPGEYHLFCAEYCGTLHSGMIGKIIAMDPPAFQAWLAGDKGVSVAEAGAQLFQQQGCASCHLGGPGARGPLLGGIFGKTVKLTDGRTVTVDDNYLRESILNPQAKLVEGYQPIMPTFQGLLSEESVMQLIAYVKSLPPAGAEAPSSAKAHSGAEAH
ncbi:MAG: cytochrome c oxidase subunit II [bacterium]|nr:cytochrome c oxidase subunit II [bacterium]